MFFKKTESLAIDSLREMVKASTIASVHPLDDPGEEGLITDYRRRPKVLKNVAFPPLYLMVRIPMNRLSRRCLRSGLSGVCLVCEASQSVE